MSAWVWRTNSKQLRIWAKSTASLSKALMSQFKIRGTSRRRSIGASSGRWTIMRGCSIQAPKIIVRPSLGLILTPITTGTRTQIPLWRGLKIVTTSPMINPIFMTPWWIHKIIRFLGEAANRINSYREIHSSPKPSVNENIKYPSSMILVPSRYFLR